MGKGVKDKVEYMLKNYPATRDDDTTLIVSLWWTYYRDHFVEDKEKRRYIQIEKILEMPSHESIARCRRKFQEEGKYHGSPEVMERRRKKERNVKKTINTPSWGNEF